MLVIITITVVAVVVYVAVRRYGGSKLVLQVTGDSMDILSMGTNIIIQRYACVTELMDNIATELITKI